MTDKEQTLAEEEPEKAQYQADPELEKKSKKSEKTGKPKKPRTRKQKIISHVTTALLVAVLLVGVGVMAYPTFSDWWNNLHQSKAIATYEEVVADTSQEEIDAMWAAAEAFNEKVAAAGFSLQYSDEMEKEYESLLDVSGTGIMGYVEIDSVGIKLPIYHGTSEGVLQIAVGHLEGTSLPVGGANTHCVLSGHTGLPSAKLFTDIDKLKEGDEFKLIVLDKTLTYQVDQIKVVLPEELSDLTIEEGQDLCTLVTCTPYGINTHRLLVRGHRIATAEGTDPHPSLSASRDALIINLELALPFVIIGAIALTVVLVLVRKHRKKKRMNGRDF